MREQAIIENILGQFDRSDDQLNKSFECDAEIVKVSGGNIAVTMDEFSDEDMFGDPGAAVLGSNMAIAVLSDLYACGAIPKYYIHAIVLSKGGNVEFSTELSVGVSRVLENAGCCLIGGDLGFGANWRYTATAIGELDGEKYLSRKLPLIEQELWVTGSLCDANLAALLEKPVPAFELRKIEAEYIRKNALGCIDTSGGFIDSLWTLAGNNPDLEFSIQTDELPIDKEVLVFCKENGVAPQAFLFGGAGEYELMFTLPVGVMPEMDSVRIGRVKQSSDHGIFFNTNGNFSKLKSIPPCAREITNKAEYINMILELVDRVFK